ncbi:hypothetical protein [Psychrobacillus psychrodurans]|uniref:Uncharacterized protein n=1 Tax=Psychrobacillus psychrodurans TaxID=126157 RepID=A0A9X3L7X7_9BACI|nr:hypothetical protein [Psychrobacillus psychrodurans]MCZ8533033.1 hypothetical protein [Psychrobacillus psychrodurans]
MLILLDKSIEQTLLEIKHNLNENSIEVNALNNLAIAYRSGWHIIIGPLRVLKIIKNLEHIDKSTKSVFDKLVNEYTFQKSYKDLVEEHILIKGLNGNPKRIEDTEESKYHFETPLNYFSSLARCMKTSLLCEDESDFDFYKKLCEKYIQEKHAISGIHLSFNFSNGGGVNSFRVLERGINDQGNPILAIADSDKRYPESGIGQTLTKLLKIEQKHIDRSILSVYPLPVRAKENLIPPSLYLIGTEHSVKRHLEKLYLVEKENSEKLLYFNIKDGYKVKHFKDEKFIEYYGNLFVDVEDLVSCSIDDISTKSDDGEVVVNGIKGIVEQFTNNILDNGIEQKLQVKERLQDPSPQILRIITELEAILETKKHLFNNLPQYIEEIIIELCKKLLSWGCSKGETIATLGA